LADDRARTGVEADRDANAIHAGRAELDSPNATLAPIGGEDWEEAAENENERFEHGGYSHGQGGGRFDDCKSDQIQKPRSAAPIPARTSLPGSAIVASRLLLATEFRIGMEMVGKTAGRAA
jgi:hypothetical protein